MMAALPSSAIRLILTVSLFALLPGLGLAEDSALQPAPSVRPPLLLHVVLKPEESRFRLLPLTNYVNFALYKHHPYVSLTGHFFGALVLVCNRAWFGSLPASQQAALLDAASHATQLQRQRAAQEDAAMVERIREAGAQIIEAAQLDLEAMKLATRFIVERERAQLAPQIVKAYLDQVMA